MDTAGTIVACWNIAGVILGKAQRLVANEQLLSMSETGRELRKSTAFRMFVQHV